LAFLDRGIVDGAGYCTHFDIPLPEGLLEIGQRRYEKVFLLDILPEYRNDEHRKEDAAEALMIHTAIKEAYMSFGYDVVDVPVLPPDERVVFILERI
jgi:predicted ATPase